MKRRKLGHTFQMGYRLEDGDFDAVGDLLAHATFGADRIGREFSGRLQPGSDFHFGIDARR